MILTLPSSMTSAVAFLTDTSFPVTVRPRLGDGFGRQAQPAGRLIVQADPVGVPSGVHHEPKAATIYARGNGQDVWLWSFEWHHPVAITSQRFERDLRGKIGRGKANAGNDDEAKEQPQSQSRME